MKQPGSPKKFPGVVAYAPPSQVEEPRSPSAWLQEGIDNGTDDDNSSSGFANTTTPSPTKTWKSSTSCSTSTRGPTFAGRSCT